MHREILLAFWKIHILHHAENHAVYGQWMLDELRRHGFRLSPGTLYPLLRRMERHGWLRAGRTHGAGSKARRDYLLTRKGAGELGILRRSIRELYREVGRGPQRPRRRSIVRSSAHRGR